MFEKLRISAKTITFLQKEEKSLQEIYTKIDETCRLNHLKVLTAFHEYNVNESYFNSTTGYGYNDIGRENIEKIFAEVLGGEAALVRSQFISGTHALTVALFAFLRPNDKMLSIIGLTYDTLH